MDAGLDPNQQKEQLFMKYYVLSYTWNVINYGISKSLCTQHYKFPNATWKLCQNEEYLSKL